MSGSSPDFFQAVLNTRRVFGIIERNIGHADNRVHRGADVMRHLGEKIGFCLAGCIRGLKRLVHAALVVEEAFDGCPLRLVLVQDKNKAGIPVKRRGKQAQQAAVWLVAERSYIHTAHECGKNWKNIAERLSGDRHRGKL